MAVQLYDKYVTNYEDAIAEMYSLEIGQQCFLINILPPPLQLPKAMQIQCDGVIAD